MDSKFRSRKFFLACVSLATVIVGLFAGTLTEQTFAVLVGGILGLYGYQNIQDRSK